MVKRGCDIFFLLIIKELQVNELVRGFQAHSQGDEGVFITDIEFERGINQVGEEFGMKVSDYKAAFLREAPTICHQMGIAVGYNETEKGFQLGFEDKADYPSFMEKIEARLAELARHFGQLLPHEYEMLEREFLKHGVSREEFADLSERLATPAHP